MTGAIIDPSGLASGDSRSKMPTSYYVHDRAYCGRVVASFEAPHRPAGRVAVGSTYDERRRLLAVAAAAELNARDEAGELTREEGEHE